MRYFFALLSVAILAGAASAATPSDDHSQVQASLTSQGFSKWKRVELDNGIWEVDDAIDASGKQFDLRLDAKTMKVISKIAE